MRPLARTIGSDAGSRPCSGYRIPRMAGLFDRGSRPHRLPRLPYAAVVRALAWRSCPIVQPFRLAAFLDDIREHDGIASRRVAQRLRVPMSHPAKPTHVNRNTMTAGAERPAVAVQARLGEIARIIARAADLSGDEGRAINWFKHRPLPGFGKTPEELVEDGQAALVLEQLERMAAGAHS